MVIFVVRHSCHVLVCLCCSRRRWYTSFFFKQKTAYEVRISDWSSDVCSSDLALGRSRGGFSTKLHARCDARGLPLGFVLTPGQAHDVQGFAPLFRMISDRIGDRKSTRLNSSH